MQLFKTSTLALAATAATLAVATAQSASSSASLQQQDCSFSCIDQFDPLCASDGKTYSNDCVFGRAVCESGDATLSVVARGECSSGDASSAGSSGESEVDACLQEFACLAIFDPVCGNDGETYSNECELKRAQCTNATLAMASAGECGASAGGSASEPSAAGSVGGADCSSAACTKERVPVCGSDGVTYANNCVFRNAQCGDASLTVASDGECPTSSTASSTSLASGSVEEVSSASASASTADDTSGAGKVALPSVVASSAALAGLIGLVL